jgi:hypothetical protein
MGRPSRAEIRSEALRRIHTRGGTSHHGLFGRGKERPSPADLLDAEEALRARRKRR